MSYQPTPIREEGDQDRALTSDERVIQLLEKVATLLEKIEYHQYLLTDADLNQ